jgi:uncharacterized coiled-coil DUF342 family protein
MKSPFSHELAAESQSVGWISSTDAMLLFVAMLTIVALVFQQQWVAAEKDREFSESERERLVQEGIKSSNRYHGEVGALREELTRAEYELQKLRELVREAGGSYEESLAEIRRLKEKLTQEESVTVALRRMLKEAREREEQLLAETSLLRKGIESLTASIQEEKARALQLQRQINALLPLEPLPDQIADLRKRLDAASLLIDKLKAAGRQVREGARSLQEKVDSIQAEKDALESLLAVRDARIAELTSELNQIKSDYAQSQRSQASIKRELVGLTGDFKRVAILFDASGSMNEQGRWASARKVVEAWVAHLEMREFCVIVFNSSLTVYPENGSLLRFDGQDGDQRRRELTQYLSDVKPIGGTFTRLAFERAYQIKDLDTIILFTDGAPNNGDSSVFDPAEAEKIYKLCQSHPNVTVNTVGLGDYFKPELSGFLMKVAEITGGSYLGR